MKAIRISLLILLTFGCARTNEKKLEDIQFLLDQGKYAQAETEAREVVASDPTNEKAKFYLGSSLLGQAVLNDGGTYLGLLSRIVEDRASSEDTDLSTFVRIAPTDASLISTLEEATDTFDGIASTTDQDLKRNTNLQLYVSKLFEISGAITRIGANTANDVCNADPANAFKDDIPDGFVSNALTSAQAARFQNNLDTIDTNRSNGGLPGDFALNARLTSMASDLATATTAQGGDAALGAADYFNTTFADASKATCTVSK